MFRIFICTVALLFCSRVAVEERERLIVWNVGQGLWLTVVRFDECLHLDMGGEKINWKKLMSACSRKSKNKAYFSHWDNDHIKFTKQASLKLANFCVAKAPRGPASKKKSALFSNLKSCDESKDLPEVAFRPLIKKRSVANDHSRIFTLGKFLFPGDTTAKQEKLWLTRLNNKTQFGFLILAHHGSNTSTSSKFLSQLPRLKLAIASARKKRYGHPHRLVLERLRSRGIATLSTENWNNIVIEIK